MSSIAIGAITYGKSIEEMRMKIAFRTITAMAKCNTPFFVVDGGSPQEVVDEMRRLGAIVETQKEKGFGNAIRQAFEGAQGIAGSSGCVGFIEAQKESIVSEIPKLAAPILSGEAAMVTAIRSEAGRMSYPPEQYCSERFGVLQIQAILGENLRTKAALGSFFGPIFLNSEALPFFLERDPHPELPPEIADLWNCYGIRPRMRVVAAGLSWREMTTAYMNPADQTAAETGDPWLNLKRLNQLLLISTEAWLTAKDLGYTDLPADVPQFAKVWGAK